ncbi:translocation/assembly module TamB domain-containing protein [Roseibium sp. M-1]
MRFINLTLRIFGFLIAIAVAVPVLAISAMQVPAGRTFVSSVVSSLASSEDLAVKIEGLYLSFGLNAAVDRVELSDKVGTWLSAETIVFDWHPLSILTGDINVSTLSAAQISLDRPPAPASAATASETNAGESESSGLALPFNVKLDKLSLGEINLGEPLLGAPISLTASGSGDFALDPALITVELDIHRIDGVDAGLTARAEFEPAAERLAFDITASEPQGGLAARLLDVPDLPALKLDLNGNGPLTDWTANLKLAVDGRTTVTGSAWLVEVSSDRHLTFDLDGDLAPLAPPAAHAFLLGTTNAKGKAVFAANFSPRAADLALKTQTVNLAATAELGAEAVDVSADLSVAAGNDTLIALDLGDRRVAFGALSSVLKVSGQRAAANWSATANLSSLQTAELRSGAIRLTASGDGADLSPGAMTAPFALALAVSGLEGLTPQLEPLSGPLSLKSNGVVDLAAQAAEVKDLTLTTAIANLALSDADVSADTFKGQGQLSLADLTRLSGLAGRELAGSVSGTFSADLDVSTLSGTAETALVTRDLQTGVAQADALLTGETRIDAVLALAGADDITVKSLAIGNKALEVKGDARYQQGELTSDLTASLADLARIDPQLEGSVDLSASTSGPVGALQVQAEASSDKILLAGTPLENLKFTADATADPAAPTAKIISSASLNGQPIAVDVDLTSADGGASIDPLSVKLAGNTVTGTVSLSDLNNPVETLRGDLQIDAPDLASLSPLLLTEISGRIVGTAKADPDKKQLALDITGSDISVPSLTLGSLKLKANLAAPYAPETVSADIDLSDILTDATPVHAVSFQARPENGGTAVTADVKLDKSGKDGLTFNANISEPDTGTYVVALAELAMRYQGLSSQLKQPTKVTYAAGEATIEPLELQLGNGSLALSGKAGTTLDLSAELNSVPLNLANAFAPSLGLGGSLSGKISAAGSSSAPEASWTINGNGLTAAELRNNGLSALSLASTGSLKNNQINQTTKVSDPNGLNLSASGTVGLQQPNQLALTLDGTVPTAALRRPMLEAGLRGEGAIGLKGSVGGSATAPTYQITATPSGLKITSLSTGLTVQNVRGTASVSQDQASLNGIAGDLATGGALSASGTVGMKDGFPADLSLKLDKGRYVDPGLVSAEVDADLKVAGPLASTSSSALISGTVSINKADVSIPEYLPGAIPPVDVRHVNAPAAVRQQVADLGGGAATSQAQQRSFPPRLDILLQAPGRIFIRGRGLDAELQGQLKIVGTTASPQAIGAFNLKRGQLDILTRRLLFSRGNATFEGSLTPILDFAASTTVSETTITVSVSGEADDPDIAFSSSPELPQDEVLALLLFGKSVGNLSPTQVARLAAAIATLTGGSDNGPLAQIRKSLGLDAIDINTDGDDGPSVAVGKYINDNIYVGVEQGTGSGSSRVKVDIDLDRGLKVRGEVGADGSSKAGIFFEREY